MENQGTKAIGFWENISKFLTLSKAIVHLELRYSQSFCLDYKLHYMVVSNPYSMTNIAQAKLWQMNYQNEFT